MNVDVQGVRRGEQGISASGITPGPRTAVGDGPIAAPPKLLLPGMDAAGQRHSSRRRVGLWAACAFLVVVVVAAVFAPVIVSLAGAPPPAEIDPAALTRSFGSATGPSAEHWFGVDQLGRDVFSRTIYGARISLAVAVPASILALLVGVAVGMVAGLRGGWLDSLLSRTIEAFLVIPYLLLAIGVAVSCSGPEGCLAGTIRPGIGLVILVIAIASWPWIARLTRNQTIAIAQSDYIAQARISGLSTPRILAGEILPNLGGTVLVFITILVPQAILAEAALSFLGAGVSMATPSWGEQISSAVRPFPEAWWMMLFPGLALLVTVSAITVIGDRLRDRGVLTKGGETS